MTTPTDEQHRRVGVVGIDCVFPGASGRERFWEMLVRGEHGISLPPTTRWDVSPTGRRGMAPAGFIEDPEGFDCAFFGVTPAEAAGMDVQQRLVLESAWRACEDAGIPPASLAGTPTGVYVGVMSSDWSSINVTSPASMTPHLGMGSGHCMIANRVSYHLDLRGPSMSIDTACSSSLVSLHLAAQAIRSGDCDIAVVGGVNLMLSPALPMFYEAAGLAAPDGRSKPYSSRADGIGRGEGVGVVVLRVLDDEVESSGLVYAEVLGGRVGHDGRSNGLTAPNKWAQVDVVHRALKSARVTAADVTFVEGHGTGTTLGDMIESRALGEVFGDRQEPCLLGSVKGNVGHLEGAAGIAGVIKACLALERRTLPPSVFGDTENPDLALADRGLALAQGAVRLPADAICGVSSFGMGGTDAHVLFRGVPTPRRRTRGTQPGVVTVSAATPAALSANIARIAEYLDTVPDTDFTRVCWSTNVVRSDRHVRLAVAAADRVSAVKKLRVRLRDNIAFRTPARRTRPRVAFLFTGQGSLTAGVAAATVACSPLVRTHLEEALARFDDPTAGRIRSVLLESPTSETTAILNTDAASSQPAMFALQYALAAAYVDLGIAPVAVLGHSIGEIAAACISGALDLGTAADLVLARGRAMNEMPESGGMVALRVSVDDARKWLANRTDIVVAADNGPVNTVLSGTDSAIHDAVAAFADSSPRILQVTNAFHSPLVAAAGDVLARELDSMPDPLPASVPFYSTLRGGVLEERLTPEYWSDQVSSPVLFREAFRELCTSEPTHLLEIGPRGVLTAFAAEQGGDVLTRLVSLDGDRTTGIEFADTIARLHEDGAEIDWAGLYEPHHRMPVRIPGYEFDHEQHPMPLYPGGRIPGGIPAAPGDGRRSGPEPAEDSRGDSSRTRPTAPPIASTVLDTAGVATIVLETLREVSGFDERDLVPGARLRDDLGFDSILAVQLGDRLTDRLPLAAPIAITEFVESLDTVETLVAFAARHIEGNL